MKKITNKTPYYVAHNTQFTHVRGLIAAYAKLAEYIGVTPAEIIAARKHRNCAGYIKRITAAEARAAGI
jgi:hypothetical protein